MERNHYSNKKWKHSKNSNANKKEKLQAKAEPEVPYEKVQFKVVNCAYCGKPIEELATAMGSKEKGEPVHFDCVLDKLKESEKLLPDESIAYIGQGRFGVVTYPDPKDQIHFNIRRIIEWEERDNPMEWRQEIADTLSSIK
ncbi:MAG: hypothetical protein K5839_02855 [Treponemataceae bacterium]|nr:hypothetical protein [Treponemataceae bacterium]